MGFDVQESVGLFYNNKRSLPNNKDPDLRIKILTIKPNNKDPDPDPDSLITIKIPAFRKGKKELSGMKVEQTRRIARMFAFM